MQRSTPKQLGEKSVTPCLRCFLSFCSSFVLDMLRWYQILRMCKDCLQQVSTKMDVPSQTSNRFQEFTCMDSMGQRRHGCCRNKDFRRSCLALSLFYTTFKASLVSRTIYFYHFLFEVPWLGVSINNPTKTHHVPCPTSFLGTGMAARHVQLEEQPNRGRLPRTRS